VSTDSSAKIALIIASVRRIYLLALPNRLVQVLVANQFACGSDLR
jgi:hypothetical protein